MKILLVILSLLYTLPSFAAVDSRMVGSWKGNCSPYGKIFEDAVYDIKANGEAVWVERTFKNATCSGSPDSTTLLQNFSLLTQDGADASQVKAHFHVGIPDIQLPEYYHFIDFKFIFDFVSPNSIKSSLVESTLQENGTPVVTTNGNPYPEFLTRVNQDSDE